MITQKYAIQHVITVQLHHVHKKNILKKQISCAVVCKKCSSLHQPLQQNCWDSHSKTLKSKLEVASKGFHGLSHYGSGKHAFKTEDHVMIFIQHLIFKDILVETAYVVNNCLTTHITLGSK